MAEQPNTRVIIDDEKLQYFTHLRGPMPEGIAYLLEEERSAGKPKVENYLSNLMRLVTAQDGQRTKDAIEMAKASRQEPWAMTPGFAPDYAQPNGAPAPPGTNGATEEQEQPKKKKLGFLG